LVLSSAEIFDPASRTWSSTGPLVIAREYHTTTMLTTGQLLLTGGYNHDVGGTLPSAQLYDSGLGFSNSWRPQIAGVTSPLALGASLVVTGSQFRGVSGGSTGNSQDSPTDHPFVQLRSFESGQAAFLLASNWSASSFTSSRLWNFPPGYALATVFVSGIQSTSAVVNISVPTPAPAMISGAKTAGGPFVLSFSNSVGAVFGVLTSTNVGLPLTNWTVLGGIVEVSPGRFQFAEPQATNGQRHFYRTVAR
jgi:hypothetical protein